MIESIHNLPPGVDGLRLDRTITREDIDLVVLPLLEEAHENGQRLRLLAEVPSTFECVDPGAIWEELRVGLKYIRAAERCAVVSDLTYVRASAHVKALFSGLIHCTIEVFHIDERDKAIEWLQSVTEAVHKHARSS